MYCKDWYMSFFLIFSNADCEWRIVAANTSHIIQMVVEDTSIEYHADCVYDAAEVYDGKLYTYTTDYSITMQH